jgi:hypothetical protein
MGVDIAKLKKANAERWQNMKIDSHLVAAIQKLRTDWSLPKQRDGIKQFQRKRTSLGRS